MLDVSRCKVPTMESVFSLIDLLTELRINELQLYIEHTFAFSKHKEVWEHASPFTANEIQEIDRYCKDRFIELIPNLNSFGHFERWLCHETYKHLAECPNGFTRKEPFMVRKHGTTLKPNQASLDLIDSLYSEYLPNFSSNKFNVGMDEPWELGQGWSREKIKKLGKDKIYLDHLNSIRKLVESHGKEMQFGQMYFWKTLKMRNSSPPQPYQLSGGTNPTTLLPSKLMPFHHVDCNIHLRQAPEHGEVFLVVGPTPKQTLTPLYQMLKNSMLKEYC